MINQESEAALVKRINRALAPDFEMLRKSRGTQMLIDVGEYYLHDLRQNLILEHNVDPESLGRELGVLKDWEAVTA